jgi:hypothetical protein
MTAHNSMASRSSTRGVLWPAHAVPGASRGLTEAEAALLAQLLRRPHALNKRERDLLIKLQRKVK